MLRSALASSRQENQGLLIDPRAVFKISRSKFKFSPSHQMLVDQNFLPISFLIAFR